MRTGKIIISAVAAIAAFGASLGAVETGNYLTSILQPFKPNIAKIETAPIISDELTIIGTEQPKISDADKAFHDEYSEPGEVGYYYIIGTPKLEDNPKGFKDFDYFELFKNRDENKTDKLISIKTTGMVYTKDVFDLAQLEIGGKKISFTTQKRNGVLYKMEGKFVEEEITVKDADGEDYTDTIVIKGHLTKWKNGVKIAEADVNFGFTVGC